jgi:hypothetical protein
LGQVFATTIQGQYKVNPPLGPTTITPALLVNYPAYFEPHFWGTLWDRYHWIDDPQRNPRLHKKWSVKIEMCCEDIDRLNLTSVTGSNGQRLLYPVILDTAYYNIGVITSIILHYGAGDANGEGQYIEISGIV